MNKCDWPTASQKKGKRMSKDKRQKWYPSNGTDGMMIDAYCSNCIHDADNQCPIILQSLLANNKDEMPDEWTADDIYGRGFACSKKTTENDQ